MLQAMSQIYQDKRTGKRVKIVGGMSLKEDFVLVHSGSEPPYYAQVDALYPCDERGMPDRTSVARPRVEELDEPMPEPVIPIVETRLNLNMASPEEISKRIPGVGYRIAKRIYEQRLSLPGEKFTTLDQVKSISSRVDWDAVESQNLIFIA